ncbi:MAG: YlxR family protein [Candidatus Gastranaerophilaceae bacterium]
MKNIRKCVGCGSLHKTKDLIKITHSRELNAVIINPDTKIFGRSVYLCYNKMCIENALKKNKLDKALKTAISNELKGKLIEFE